MDVFNLRNKLIEDYATYIESFIKIQDERMAAKVQDEMRQGVLWPDPLIQLNPNFEPGEWINDLTVQNTLHPLTSKIFRLGKDNSNDGQPMRLHHHQADAVLAARSGDNYVLTTGTGQSYQTRLDPPPGDPRAAHSWDEEYLGPYKAPEDWWQVIEPTVGTGETVGQPLADQPASLAPAVSPAAPKTIKEPSPTFELKPPPSPAKKKKTRPRSLPDQPSLIRDFSPPQGNRSQRLKRVMALGQPKNSAELGELAAALGDDDSNIRWLAGSSLVRLRGHAVVQTLAAFLNANPGQPAQAEALKVLSLIADTGEDETVREAARNVIEEIQSANWEG